MPPPATPAAQNEIVNRAFQSVTGLTPETTPGTSPVGYAGEARQTVDLADAYNFGAANPYVAPAPESPPPAPMPVQSVPVNPVINVAPPAPASAPVTPATGSPAGAPNPIPPKPVYPVGRNIPWQETTKYWQDMDAYRKAGGT